MDKFVLRARFFHLKSVSKAFLEFEWKESKNFGNCCEAGNRFDTTVSKKRDNDGIPSQMDGIRMLFSFFFFFNPRFPFVHRREESRRIRRIKRDLNFEEERRGKKTYEKKIGMVELQSDINNKVLTLEGD